MDNWFEISVAIYLIGMVLYGHYRGLIRLVVSISSIILTLLMVQMITPHISGALAGNQLFHKIVKSQIQETIDANYQVSEEIDRVALQRTAIEELNLPHQLKDILIENNNNEVYDMLGVDQFVDYISNALVRVILNAISSIITFIIVYFIIRIFLRWFDFVSKLPILNGINQIAGAVTGLIEGMLLLWLMLLVISLFSATEGGQILVEQIDRSRWLSYFYYSNIFSKMLFIFLRRML